MTCSVQSVHSGGVGGGFWPDKAVLFCSELQALFPTALIHLTRSPSSFIFGGTNPSRERKLPAPTADTNPTESLHLHSDWLPLIKGSREKEGFAFHFPPASPLSSFLWALQNGPSAACVTLVTLCLPLHLRVPPKEKQVALWNNWNM